MTMRGQGSIHDAVGAYVLGVLDDADMSAFEVHLAGCEMCAGRLEEFSCLEPMLAVLAEAPVPPAATPSPPPGSRCSPLSPHSPHSSRAPYSPYAPYSTEPPHSPGAIRSSGSARPYRPGAGPGARGGPGWEGPPGRPPGAPGAPGAHLPPVPPAPRALDGLLGQVAAARSARRRRGTYLVAAAAALIVAAPVVTYLIADGGGQPGVGTGPLPMAPSEHALLAEMRDKARATDPTTLVSATVGMEPRGWGTRTVLELKGVKGPLKCNLVAVSKTGEEEVITSWAVPAWGYGIPDGPTGASRHPLYVHGGAAMDREEIDRFEVRTFGNQKLVEIDV